MGKVCLSNSRLSQVFKNTTATYKFYWFLSLLEIHAKQNKEIIAFDEIIVNMIAMSWYPIHYFRISFGKSDSMYESIMRLHQKTNLTIDANREKICDRLLELKERSDVRKELNLFATNVPYRFLSPWIKYTSDKNVIHDSQLFLNDCPYSIKDNCIIINPQWSDYLRDNCKILMDYCYWNLAQFLEVRNPNVPDIPGKLIKPAERRSLSEQRKFWNVVLRQIGPINCIYTGKELSLDYDLDHFIPWSFVSHDLLWNLLPTDSSINSSKSNKLPDTEKYLPPFARYQQDAMKVIYAIDSSNRLLEDYQNLGPSVADLISMSEGDFYRTYYKTVSPMMQIAENMGFERWIIA